VANDDLTALEWQVAEGSRRLHVIDTSRPPGKKSGPRALCGKYPQVRRGIWYGLAIQEFDAFRPGRDLMWSYSLTMCLQCSRELDTVLAEKGADRG
jgi:hypothetical protein